jgi:hypothetical protein
MLRVQAEGPVYSHVSIGAKQPNKDECHGLASGAAGAVMTLESARPSLKRLTQSWTSLLSMGPGLAGAAAGAPFDAIARCWWKE